jgi:hypothetical protein
VRWGSGGGSGGETTSVLEADQSKEVMRYRRGGEVAQLGGRETEGEERRRRLGAISEKRSGAGVTWLRSTAVGCWSEAGSRHE